MNTRERLVRLKEIIGSKKDNIPAILPISKSKLWADVKTGKFPQPIKLGKKTTCWRLSEIMSLIDGRP